MVESKQKIEISEEEAKRIGVTLAYTRARILGFLREGYQSPQKYAIIADLSISRMEINQIIKEIIRKNPKWKDILDKALAEEEDKMKKAKEEELKHIKEMDISAAGKGRYHG